ncbi:AI-2E family transporter [Pseudoroseomonas globiformis]|uniref:AI-2E family transporter n=1 Tax=Teichococcus globiformis TaxID=2307229 RepID=A0ABV7G7S0_9PROT
MPDLPPFRMAPPQAGSASELRSLTTLIGGVVLVAALYLGRDVLIPVTLAILLSLVLSPLVRLLRRFRLGRVTSVLLAVALALGVALATAAVIGAQLAELVQNIGLYQTTIQQKLDALKALTFNRVDSVLERLSGDLGRPSPQVAPVAPPAASGEGGTGAPAPIPVEVHEPDLTPLQILDRVATPLMGPLAQAGIVLLVSIFVLLRREDLRDRLIRLFGATDLHRTTIAMDDAAYRLSRFFLAQLTINIAFGAAIGLGLLLIGLPSPLLWGILAALLRFVPYVGAILGALLPIALAAAVDPGWSLMLWTIALFLALEPVIAHVVEPLVYGHSTGMSPVSVVIATIFWSWIWGPIGLIIATPLTLCLVVMGRHVQRFEFLDVLLGDRPALTPVENFYQRALAGDPDEAEEQAELLLRDRPLSAYYDEVALRGLALAAADVRRGLVTPPQLERIREAVTELSDALEDHPDSVPVPTRLLRLPTSQPASPEPGTPELAPEWQAEGAVLCVAGRGPLDDIASVLTAQILRKHGFGVRIISHAAVSRREVGQLQGEGVRLACICALRVPGPTSHLRYLLRRLRQRLPETPVLISLFGEAGESTVLEEAENTPPMADSLRETVQFCLQAAAGEGETVPAP